MTQITNYICQCAILTNTSALHLYYTSDLCAFERERDDRNREGERENMISILRLTQWGKDVEAEAGTLRRLAAGNRWSGGERKHDQDV